MLAPPTKICRACGETKPSSEFYIATGNRDGKTSECKRCHNERSRTYRKAIANGTANRRKAFDPDATAKVCAACKIEKSLNEFHVGRNRDKKHSCCKLCRRARDKTDPKLKLYRKRYKEKNAERLKAYYQSRREHQLSKHAEYYATVRGRAVRLFNSAKKSPDGCSLTLDHIMRGIETGHCPVTGIPFDLRPNEKSRSGRQTNPFAPSLDRLDPRKGYTNENTRVVIWHYNAMKGELSDAEVLRICECVLARIKDAA